MNVEIYFGHLSLAFAAGKVLRVWSTSTRMPGLLSAPTQVRKRPWGRTATPHTLGVRGRGPRFMFCFKQILTNAFDKQMYVHIFTKWKNTWLHAKHLFLFKRSAVLPTYSWLPLSPRFCVHSLRQSVPHLLGHHHLRLLRLSAPPVPLRHGHQQCFAGCRLPAPPNPGLPASLQPPGHAPDTLSPSRHHAGQRALLPLLPHATLPPLLPARPLCRHPRTTPLLNGHDPLCMTQPGALGQNQTSISKPHASS